MIVVLKFFAAFLIGAIPFAKIAMLGSGIDITRVGSKNPGFRNVSRVASRWRAAICLIGDVGKGLFGVWLVGRGEISALTLWGMCIFDVMGYCCSHVLGL